MRQESSYMTQKNRILNNQIRELSIPDTEVDEGMRVETNEGPAQQEGRRMTTWSLC
jgi:hypothetical protein